MSVMTRGIIAQPYSLAMHSDYSRRQFYSHAQVLLADHDSARKHWENESNNVQALMDEVARLKAEIAGLKTGYEAYEQTVKELRAEVEALRKERDARHPFKPFHEPSIGFTGCVICGVYTDHGGLPCPKTRATADAAMGQGEQS